MQKMASAVMYEVEQMPGILANRCVDILWARYKYSKSGLHAAIDELVTTGYIECEGTALYPNNSMPKLDAVSLEGLRLTPKYSLGLKANDIWRVDENHNLVEIHEDPVGATSLLTHNQWYPAYHNGEYANVCSICINNLVVHELRELYPICKQCYRSIAIKPELTQDKHIIEAINAKRVNDDLVLSKDKMLFRVIQQSINDDTEELANKLLK